LPDKNGGNKDNKNKKMDGITYPIDLNSIDPEIKRKYNLEERWKNAYRILARGGMRALEAERKKLKEMEKDSNSKLGGEDGSHET